LVAPHPRGWGATILPVPRWSTFRLPYRSTFPLPFTEGWVGEEAFAISVYSALKYNNNFKQGITAAVNHSGDSDSTGAITGNILGAWMGCSSIPDNWVEKVEFREVITQVADDLFTGFKEGHEWSGRYPVY